MERATLQQKLAAAARSEEPICTPECLEPDTLIALIEEGAGTPAAAAQMAHVVSCAYCRREFDAMEQTLQIAARVRELQAPAPALAATSPLQEETRSASFAPLPFWRRLFAPSLGFALGAAAAGLLFYLMAVQPLERQTGRLNAQIAQQEREVDVRLAQTNERAASLLKEKEALEQSAKQSQIRIAALERSVAQAAQRTDNNELALAALQEAASLSDQALTVLNETQRGPGNPGSEPSPIGLLSPVANVLLNPRVTFRWETAEDATAYMVLVLDSASREVAKSAPLTKTEWTTLLPSAKGKEALNYYEWVVVARRGQQEIGRSSAKRFAVLDAKRLVEQVREKQGTGKNAGTD